MVNVGKYTSPMDGMGHIIIILSSCLYTNATHPTPHSQAIFAMNEFVTSDYKNVETSAVQRSISGQKSSYK